MTAEEVERAFDLLAEDAAEQGFVAEIAVFGGSCIMLASDLRQATGDVDAVFMRNNDFLYEAAERVRSRLDLPEEWLNQAVRQLAPPKGGAQPNLLLFGEYPRHQRTAVGLRVHMPTPEYILAMKLLANRLEDDLVKIETDRADIHGLMQITGITTYDALAALLRLCYPMIPGVTESGISPRLEAKLRTILDEHGGASADPEPTWRAGRGPTTRDG